GVEVVYLLTPQLPESVEYVRAAVAAARTSGVQRIVRQSVFNAADGADGIARWHREAEELIGSSGLRYTFVRANAFMQNFATIYRPSIVERDTFSLPLGEARLSNVDARDVAAAATALLLDDEFDGSVSTLTGPEALGGEEMARALTGVTGRLIRYRDEPEDEGTPAGPVDAAHVAERDALRELGAEMRAGRLSAVTDDVARLTGRQPLSFEQFARDHAWAFSRHPYAQDESEGVSYG
ncbi:MAG TPA: NmrA family NAD(P)-binding protein, partial [Thermoleophilia bacterium]|nr:NmrA family NAD(P)-binding protein [Thermoleophilia bacterium]